MRKRYWGCIKIAPDGNPVDAWVIASERRPDVPDATGVIPVPFDGQGGFVFIKYSTKARVEDAIEWRLHVGAWPWEFLRWGERRYEPSADLVRVVCWRLQKGGK